MPIYEYACGTCNQTFERLVRSMKDEGQQTCPKCGSAQTQRKLSVFAVGAEPARSPRAPGMCGRCGEEGGCGMG